MLGIIADDGAKLRRIKISGLEGASLEALGAVRIFGNDRQPLCKPDNDVGRRPLGRGDAEGRLYGSTELDYGAGITVAQRLQVRNSSLSKKRL